MVLDAVAQRYGQLPSTVLREGTLLDHAVAKTAIMIHNSMAAQDQGD